jgi:hypothetical protein
MTVNLTDGSVELETIDSEPLDQETADRYTTMVGNAIVGEKARLDAAAEAAAKPRGGSSPTTAAAPVQPSNDTASTAGRAEPRAKTRGTADPARIAEEAPAGEAGVEETHISVTLAGLNAERVAGLLGDQRISGIEPAAVVQKLTYLAGRANATNTSFGQRAPLAGIKGGDQVRLREVKWIAGSHQQVRVYFREGERGNLELVGINDKDGKAQHESYLTKLVRRVNQQDSTGTGRERGGRPDRRRR